MKPRREPPAMYPIRAVSKLTGIGIDTLRAWERRHGAVTPIRDARGRMYTGADVARLRLLRGAVERGHTIGRLAALGNSALHALAADAIDAVDGSAAEPVSRTPPEGAALIAALHAFDGPGADREIARLSSMLTPLDLLREVLMPILARTGEAWKRGRGRIAQEHLMSATVRNILGSLLRLHARPDRPVRLLFATPAGDRHEIGTLGAAMLAASSGLGVAYLGPDLPAREIVDSVTRAGAHVLVLGVTTTSARKTTERELRAIVRDLPPGVELWAGGRGAERYASIIQPRGTVFSDYAEYQQALGAIGNSLSRPA